MVINKQKKKVLIFFRDVKKPYIPTLSFISHQDVVADIAWPKMSSNKIYTCGKDCNLMIQPTKTAYKPYEHLRTVAVTWTPNGDIALINDKINRQSSEEYVKMCLFILIIIERHQAWFFHRFLHLDNRNLLFRCSHQEKGSEKQAVRKNNDFF